MRIKINLDRPRTIIEELQDIKAEIRADIVSSSTTDCSFQDYFEREWLKHFSDIRGSKPNLLIVTKRPRNGK